MRYICFDFETNGFYDPTSKYPNYTMPYESHPVQLSIDIVDEDGTITHAYDTVIAGAKGFTQWVVDNVPITLEQVRREGRPFREVLDVFAGLIQDGDILVAHNLEFDFNRVIVKSITRMNIESPAAERIRAAPKFCTMKCSYSTSSFGKQVKFSKLCEHFGVTLNNAHDATADAYALAECVSEALRRGVMVGTSERYTPSVPKPKPIPVRKPTLEPKPTTK